VTQDADDLIGSDYAMPGTLASRFMRCGKANRRGKAEPPVLHGPYLHWTAPSPARPWPAPSPRVRPRDTSPGSITPADSGISSPNSRPAPYAPSTTPKP